jgi:hypothetical protein
MSIKKLCGVINAILVNQSERKPTRNFLERMIRNDITDASARCVLQTLLSGDKEAGA